MNWQADLRANVKNLNTQLAWTNAVLKKMIFGSDLEATEVLARLRLGDSIEEVCRLSNIDPECQSRAFENDAFAIIARSLDFNLDSL